MKIIYKDGTVAECPKEEELHVLRHTAAHIMAQAIKRIIYLRYHIIGHTVFTDLKNRLKRICLRTKCGSFL